MRDLRVDDSIPDITVVCAGHLLTMGQLGDVADGAVAISRSTGTILDVGPRLAVLTAHPNAHVVGDRHSIVLPGFVNCHDHLSEALISGLAETMSLYEWQQRLIRPILPHLTREMARVGALLKGIEMVQSGITCVNDMFNHGTPGSLTTLGAVDGLDELGLRGVFSYAAHDWPDPFPLDSILTEHEALAERTEASPLTGFRLGIATIQSQTDELLAATVRLATQRGWKIHTHVAEVREEITDARIRFGTNTLGRARSFGVLDLDVLCAHCVWVTEADVDLLASHPSSVAHNPLANMILGSGLCPVPRLRSAGIPVGLGTDGCASNDSHDMLQVIKCAALIQKLHHLDPLALTARDVLRMATIDGARSLRLDDQIGSLDVGKRADVVRFSGSGPRLAYIHDPYQQLAYCASPGDVSDVWIDGEPIVVDRQLRTVTVSDIVTAARELAGELVEVAGLQSLLSASARSLHGPQEEPTSMVAP
jgi:5-methylthioadenosine/S-adenosylhomocysteine deaminase